MEESSRHPHLVERKKTFEHLSCKASCTVSSDALSYCVYLVITGTADFCQRPPSLSIFYTSLLDLLFYVAVPTREYPESSVSAGRYCSLSRRHIWLPTVAPFQESGCPLRVATMPG